MGMYSHLDIKNRKGNFLNIGAGNEPLSGWINIDVDRTLPDIDIYADMSVIYKYFKPCSLEKIRAHNVLCYYHRSRIPDLLKSWNSILIDNGEIEITVPDFLNTLHHILYSNKNDEEMIEIFCGKQTNTYNVVHAYFTPTTIKKTLFDTGFGKVSITTESNGLMLVSARKVRHESTE